jgi:predicted nuclease with TOPRIM domain
MAEFSGKVVDAQFVDEEHSIIKVLYEQDELIMVYNLDVNPDHPDYKQLMSEGWDLEKIAESTAEYKKAESAAFNIEVNEAARALAQEMLGMKVLQDERDRLAAEKEMLKGRTAELGEQVNSTEEILIGLDKEVKIKTNQVDSAYFEHLWEMNENKEQLFKFKLWALELDAVKDAGKEIKSSIRKATRISQGLAIIDALM